VPNRQRNNVAQLPYELRVEISRRLFENEHYAAIAQAMRAAGCQLKLHSSSLGAWQKGPEYQEYVAARKGFDARTHNRRLIAAVQNDGQGPQSLADVAEFELLERMVAIVPETADHTQVAQMARAVASLQRTQIARHVAADQARIQALEKKLLEQATAAADREAQLREQISLLQTGGKTVDGAAVAAKLNELLGVGRAAGALPPTPPGRRASPDPSSQPAGPQQTAAQPAVCRQGGQ
jgi:hypothetical protein